MSFSPLHNTTRWITSRFNFAHWSCQAQWKYFYQQQVKQIEKKRREIVYYMYVYLEWVVSHFHTQRPKVAPEQGKAWFRNEEVLSRTGKCSQAELKSSWTWGSHDHILWRRMAIVNMWRKIKALSHLIRFEFELNSHSPDAHRMQIESTSIAFTLQKFWNRIINKLLLACHTHCSPSNDFYPSFIKPTF